MRDHVSDTDVLRAARRVFLREGVRATTRQIAEEAGIAKGSLAARFGSKEELLRAAMMMEPPPWAAQLAAAVGVGDARDNLAGLFEAMIRWSARVAPLAVVGWSVPSWPEIDLEALRGERELAQYLEDELFLGRLDAVEPSLGARILAGAAWDAALSGGIGSPALAIDLLWRGLGPRPEEIELRSSNGPRPCWPPRAEATAGDAAPASVSAHADPPQAPASGEPAPPTIGTVDGAGCAVDLERTQRSATFCVPDEVRRSLLGGDRRAVRWMLRRRRAWRRRARRAGIAQRVDAAHP